MQWPTSIVVIMSPLQLSFVRVERVCMRRRSHVRSMRRSIDYFGFLNILTIYGPCTSKAKQRK